jgi:predicted enzyme related to lactoylglutathione lyase
MKVRETFLSIPVADMERARRFYVSAFDASVRYESPVWSSLRIAGVRLGLNASPHDAGSRTGLHFVVDDLAFACEAIVSAGGEVAAHPSEVQPGVVLADVADTEGNIFTLSLATED